MQEDDRRGHLAGKAQFMGDEQHPVMIVDHVLEEIVRAAELNSAGKGIAFVVRLEKVVGIAQFITEPPSPA